MVVAIKEYLGALLPISLISLSPQPNTSQIASKEIARQPIGYQPIVFICL